MLRRGASKRRYQWRGSKFQKIFSDDKPLIESAFKKEKDARGPKSTGLTKK
jgi:hypothetical protein